MANMKLTSKSFNHNQRVPARFAYGKFDPKEHCVLSTNLNPHLAWSDLPKETKSLALLCMDPDVPSLPDDVNKEGRVLSATLPRVEFCHWVLVDIPVNLAEIKEGEFSNEITPKGKPGPEASHGTRQGLNNYTDWFESDSSMSGNYFGYDGPCPPWNDAILHHYHFTLYALDIAKCAVEGKFTWQDVQKAIKGHILAQSTLTGLYAINPETTT